MTKSSSSFPSFAAGVEAFVNSIVVTGLLSIILSGIMLTVMMRTPSLLVKTSLMWWWGPGGSVQGKPPPAALLECRGEQYNPVSHMYFCCSIIL